MVNFIFKDFPQSLPTNASQISALKNSDDKSKDKMCNAENKGN